MFLVLTAPPTGQIRKVQAYAKMSENGSDIQADAFLCPNCVPEEHMANNFPCMGGFDAYYVLSHRWSR